MGNSKSLPFSCAARSSLFGRELGWSDSFCKLSLGANTPACTSLVEHFFNMVCVCACVCLAQGLAVPSRDARLDQELVQIAPACQIIAIYPNAISRNAIRSSLG